MKYKNLLTEIELTVDKTYIITTFGSNKMMFVTFKKITDRGYAFMRNDKRVNKRPMYPLNKSSDVLKFLIPNTISVQEFSDANAEMELARCKSDALYFMQKYAPKNPTALETEHMKKLMRIQSEYETSRTLMNAVSNDWIPVEQLPKLSGRVIMKFSSTGISGQNHICSGYYFHLQNMWTTDSKDYNKLEITHYIMVYDK